MSIMILLGSSKVTTHNKVTIIQDVAVELDIKTGDTLAYLQDGDRIIIKNMTDVKTS